jgi:hypothetical protein
MELVSLDTTVVLTVFPFIKKAKAIPLQALTGP